MNKDEIIEYFKHNRNKPSTTKELSKVIPILQVTISSRIRRLKKHKIIKDNPIIIHRKYTIDGVKWDYDKTVPAYNLTEYGLKNW